MRCGIGDPPISYFITTIDSEAQSATIKSTPKPRVIVIHHDVKLSELTSLDGTQNAARMTREATEDD
jgi:hypothetical protein